MSIGLEYVFDATIPTCTEPPAHARDVLDRDLEQLAGLAAEIRALAASYALDDYGVFRVALHALDDLHLSLDGTLLCVGSALVAGSWNQDSRLLALAALLRLLEYNVAPTHAAGGVVLGLPLGDAIAHYNVNVNTFKVQQRGRGRPVTIEYHWVLFDGVTPLGEPKSVGEQVLTLAELVSGVQGTFSLLERSVPPFVLSHREPRLMPVHGTEHHLSYNHLPHAHAWLLHYPPLQFGQQARVAEQELALMDLLPSLEPLLTLDEEALVNTLLRTVQGHIRYEEGPLRSLFDIFDTQHGDCDQLSLVMSALLKACGYPAESLRSMNWPGHLALAVRAKGDPPAGAVAFEVPGKGKYVALDAAFIQKMDDELSSRWGQLNQRYARLRFQHKDVG